MPTIEEENQAILDEADAIRLEYDMDEFREGSWVDPMELEEPHQPSLEELEDIFTSPDILKDCD